MEGNYFRKESIHSLTSEDEVPNYMKIAVSEDLLTLVLRASTLELDVRGGLTQGVQFLGFVSIGVLPGALHLR